MDNLPNPIRFVLLSTVYQRWTILPVLAFVLSWGTGLLSLFLFPVLLTATQYLTLKEYPGVVRPSIWFVTSLVTCYVWLKWGPPAGRSGPDGIMQGVIAHYAGQLLNSACIPLIIEYDSINATVRWLISTSIAAAVWLSLYGLLHNIKPGDWETISTAGNLSILVIYPVISLIANGISGFFLLDYKATTGDQDS